MVIVCVFWLLLLGASKDSQIVEGTDSLNTIRNILLTVILTAGMINHAVAQQYSEAIVITEKNHVLSARSVMIKTTPEAPAKPRVFTIKYDELTTVREKTTPVRVKSIKRRPGTTYKGDDFTID